MLKLIVDAIRGWRMRRALDAPGAAGGCMACDGRELAELGSEAYRCLSCGYEGGEGYARYLLGLEWDKIQALDPELRRAEAYRDLREARTLLISGLGDAQHAQGMAFVDFVGSGRDAAAEEKHKAMSASIRMLLEAKAAVEKAGMKLGRPLTLNTSSVEDGPSGALMSWDYYTDSAWADLAAYGQIRELMQRARAMIELVDRVLTEEFPRGP